MRDKSIKNLLKQEKKKERERDDKDVYKNRGNNRNYHLFFLKIAAEVDEPAADDQEKYDGCKKNVSWRLSEVPDR